MQPIGAQFAQFCAIGRQTPHVTLTLMPLESAIQRIDPHTAAIVLSGPITLGTNLKTLDSQIQTLIDSGITRLALDLAAAPYADSAGLGTLVHASGQISSRGGALRLAAVSERILAMLRMTRTEPLFVLDPDLAASLAAFSPGARAGSV